MSASKSVIAGAGLPYVPSDEALDVLDLYNHFKEQGVDHIFLCDREVIIVADWHQEVCYVD